MTRTCVRTAPTHRLHVQAAEGRRAGGLQSGGRSAALGPPVPPGRSVLTGIGTGRLGGYKRNEGDRRR